MGFRFRKSINLGGGARINFSKSGIGGSIGGKGFRYTKKAGGGTRTTASIPGTGLSYQKDSKKTKSKGKYEASTPKERSHKGKETAVAAYNYAVSTKKSIKWNKTAYWLATIFCVPMILLGLLLALVETYGWIFVGIGVIEVIAARHFKKEYKRLEAEKVCAAADI